MHAGMRRSVAKIDLDHGNAMLPIAAIAYVDPNVEKPAFEMLILPISCC